MTYLKIENPGFDFFILFGFTGGCRVSKGCDTDCADVKTWDSESNGSLTRDVVRLVGGRLVVSAGVVSWGDVTMSAGPSVAEASSFGCAFLRRLKGFPSRGATFCAGGGTISSLSFFSASSTGSSFGKFTGSSICGWRIFIELIFSFSNTVRFFEQTCLKKNDNKNLIHGKWE